MSLARRVLCWLLALAAGPGAIGAEAMRGLPFTRSYPLDEIGYVSRGPRLSFDAFGRLALAQEGMYVVLNDTVWLNLVAPLEQLPAMANLIYAPNGRAYYGGRGVWGHAEWGSNGLRPVSAVQGTPPSWTTTAYFDDLIATRDGVYFGSWNGVVFSRFDSDRVRFFEQPNTSRIFAVGEKIYVSAKDQPLQYLNIGTGALEPAAEAGRLADPVEHAAAIDPTHTLLALTDGRLLVFDGRTLTPWAGQAQQGLTGRISALAALADGGVAVAITGRGLFLTSAAGELRSAFTTNQYHLVTALASREPGVLWVALEDSIEKMLYGGPLTIFGEKLGLPVTWPVVQEWNGRPVVLSDRRLYEPVSAEPGTTSRFHLLAGQPPGDMRAMAAAGDVLLAANQSTIFAADAQGHFEAVALFPNLSHLVLVGDLCYAISNEEIGVLQREGRRWVERIPRIPGFRYPPVVHATRHAVWIEMGPDGAARLSVRDGQLHAQRIETPWPPTPWINIGIVDDIVVLSGTEGHRLYYDDAAETWCQPAELDRLLARSPIWLSRMRKDASGTIWATYGHGMVVFTQRGGAYTMDATRFELSNDRYPAMHLLPGSGLWLSTQRTLYHVEASATLLAPADRRCVLVSVVDARKNAELFLPDPAASGPHQLSYDQNSLIFRPFSGGYAWRNPPEYHFRLDHAAQWTPLDAGSTLSISELREGRHVLEIRVADAGAAANSPLTYAFEILPPWYRTSWAFALFGLGGGLLFVATARAFSYLARRRHLVLEAQVKARTAELEVAMERLNEETRNAATLAERDRLAGEIHDSMQQGLSGAIIQLDTTLKMPVVPAEVRSRLNVVRNMISYARHEVQHAVWDMESPLLENTELGSALRKVTSLLSSGEVKVETRVIGTPCPLERMTRHHFLRIAQEATANAIRHAHAAHITIELEYSPATIALTVTDDGIGFVVDEARAKTVGHFGLRGLRARAKKIGGQLSLESAPGAGTRVRVVMPRPNPSPSTHAEIYATHENPDSPGR